MMPPENAVPIEVNGRIVDPQDTYAIDARNTDHIVVSVKHILSIAEEDELYALGVKIVEDLGGNNFLCHYKEANLKPIRDKEFVSQVDVYRNKYKIPANLESLIENQAPLWIAYSASNQTAESNTCEVDVLVHDEVTDLESVKEFIASTANVPIDELEVAPGKVRLQVDPSKLVDIAKDDRVRIIEEVIEPVLHDDQAREIVHGHINIEGLSFRGSGQIVTVSDTGFDTGSRQDCHPAFKDKVLHLTPIGRSDSKNLPEQSKVDDPDGHGTHVCGIILGQDFNTSKGVVGGIAPDAKLIVQSLFESKARRIKLPVDLVSLFSGPYIDGSRIFSNSWGAGFTTVQPDYADPARIIDNFIRDKGDALVCFSAGNDNDRAKDQPAVGQQAGAKNVLTVGASGTTRDPQEGPEMMYSKSSYGPTKENRLKPDVIAPGVDIYSALSREAPYYGAAAATIESLPGIKWKPSSGTSQATPLVAGCAAVLREILQRKGCEHPPAALLKAVIINGADRLPKIDQFAQGHGRVNLQASAAMLTSRPEVSGDKMISVSMSQGTLIGHALKQDEEYEFTLSAPKKGDANTHFKITMVYNDIGNKQIQNNLNIIVTDEGTNAIKYGNEKSLTDPDVQNNVEQIVLYPLPTGDVKVKVHAQKILAQQEQDYALAWATFTPMFEEAY